MASEPMHIPVPLCEVCWLIDHTNWEPESMDENGQILMRLTGVDVPEKINTESVDICADCGSITVSGIYDFRDPALMNHLDDDDDFISEDDDPTQFTFSLNPDLDSEDGDPYE